MFNSNTTYHNLIKLWGLEISKFSVLNIFYGENSLIIDSNITNVNIYDYLNDIKFDDNKFDYVICNSILGVKSITDRPLLIDQCMRIAKYKCFFINPNDVIAMYADNDYKNSLLNSSKDIPLWLKDQSLNQYPNTSEMMSNIFNYNYDLKIMVNEGVVQRNSALLMDLICNNPLTYYDHISNKGETPYIPEIKGDMPYSLLFCLDKSIAVSDIDDLFKKIKIKMKIDSSVSLVAICHRALGIENKLSNSNPFFINKNSPKQFYKINDSDSYYENNNYRCSELSAIHNIWKRKLYKDIVGISHYRRYLYLYPEDLKDRKLHISDDEFSSVIDKIQSLDRIRELLTKYDFIVGDPIKMGSDGEYTIETFYCLNHFSNDYYKCLEILLRKYPFLKNAVMDSLNSKSLYASNIFFCKKEYFEVICSVWFDVFDEYRNEVDVSNRSPYQQRDIAFLSERIFDIIVRHLKILGCNVCELPVLHVDFRYNF